MSRKFSTTRGALVATACGPLTIRRPGAPSIAGSAAAERSSRTQTTTMRLGLPRTTARRVRCGPGVKSGNAGIAAHAPPAPNCQP